MGFLGAVVVKNLPANARDVRDLDFIPGSRRSPGGGHSKLSQNSWLENPHGQRGLGMGVGGATVHRVTQSQTQLKRVSIHSHMYFSNLHFTGSKLI